MSQSVEVKAERENSTFLCLLVLFGLSTGLKMPIHTGEGSLISSVQEFKF